MSSIYLVTRARPNFMKIAPSVRTLKAHGGLTVKPTHTGRGDFREMNDVFMPASGSARCGSIR